MGGREEEPCRLETQNQIALEQERKEDFQRSNC